MDRYLIALFMAATMLVAVALPVIADDETESPVASPSTVDDPKLLLAQIGGWGGGAGPRQRDCNRVCENEQVNCQRGCFALPEIEGQNNCSRQCLVTYVECTDSCATRTSSLDQRQDESSNDRQPSR